MLQVLMFGMWLRGGRGKKARPALGLRLLLVPDPNLTYSAWV